MRCLVLALAAVTALTGPVLAKDEAPMPPATVKFAPVPQDAVLSYNLIGLNVVDGTNSNVGEIKDIVIEKGKLAGYIVSVGGFLGMGERYVVIDPSSVALASLIELAAVKAVPPLDLVQSISRLREPEFRLRCVAPEGKRTKARSDCSGRIEAAANDQAG